MVEREKLACACNQSFLDSLPRIFKVLIKLLHDNLDDQNHELFVELMFLYRALFSMATDTAYDSMKSSPEVIRNTIVETTEELDLDESIKMLFYKTLAPAFDVVRNLWIESGGTYYESLDMLFNGLLIYDFSFILKGDQ